MHQRPALPAAEISNYFFLPPPRELPGLVFVVNDHVGPAVDPTEFFATTDHVYVVLFDSEPSDTDVVVTFDR